MIVRVLNKRVERELEDLGKEANASILRVIELMDHEETYALGLPHVRKLKHPLWEIRVSNKEGISRVVFVSVIKNEITFLLAFKKKTQKTPKHLIDLAFQRLKEIK